MHYGNETHVKDLACCIEGT